ncbi:MAG TPA: hypothetical protein VFP65_08600 [Anaeromyxobacteraceae bacterium]|nr:hypothetical protein [Anaeromyxobacteraceae bacterium]
MKAALLALLLAPPGPTDAVWRVEVATHGGLGGRGAGAVKVRSSGDIEVVAPGGQRCAMRVPAEDLARVAAALARARPQRWRPRYFQPDNPTGCCDQVATTLAVGRGAGAGERRWVTGWFDESRQLVPADALALQDAAMDLAQLHQGCAGGRP